ncbi:MAG: DUF1501 domain-containing protein [Pirellulaceae bacterium]
MNPSTRFSRRQLLQSSACGFGYLALAGMANSVRAGETQNPLAPRPTHHAPRAKRVIFVFMHGGPSQVDTFDYKPQLDKDDGKELPFEPAKNLSRGIQRKMMKSPWAFRQYGECGMWVSDLFPNVARHADDLCVVNSMHTDGQSHGQAVMRLHTGENTFVRPSVGAWVNYGLGTENENLPGFVTICPPRGHGGTRNYGSAFLPAAYQGTAIGTAGVPASRAMIEHMTAADDNASAQREQLDFLQSLNRRHWERADHDEQLEGVIDSYELAFRMQSAAPPLLDISDETAETLALYGIGEKETDDFGRQCLLARRFAEAGVRFIQVSHSLKWDQHSNLESGHERNAKEVDLPIAGLLADLKRRGLLEDTLVWWGGEFGRTPIIEGSNGRDHNPQGFTMWLAGGGVKGGMNYGSTDEYGYFAVRDKVHMHDMHATLLWMLGIDHERLTYRYAGRDFRLTDVHGRVVSGLFA